VFIFRVSDACVTAVVTASGKTAALYHVQEALMSVHGLDATLTLAMTSQCKIHKLGVVTADVHEDVAAGVQVLSFGSSS
jgi:hypothetical protein